MIDQILYGVQGKISWKFARGIQIGTGELDKGQYNDQKKWNMSVALPF